MKIIPEPVFFELLKVETGIKKGLIHILNQSDDDFTGKVTDIRGPAWIEFEKIGLGDELSIKKRGKVPFVVRVDTGHKLFADEIDDNNGVTIELADGTTLQIGIVVEEVIKEVPDYKGTFSIDFGTTNSCFAYRSRVGEESDIESAVKKAKTSDIIPSVIFFTSVDKTHPVFDIGNSALFNIEENSAQTYSYFRSIKRFLGSDRLFTVLDKYSGLKPERRQRWSSVDISAFYLSSLIREAEIEIGARIRRVIATYPVLFTKAQKISLRKAFKKAFEYLGREIDDDDIILNLDESTAAAFNYIYGPLMDEFRVYEKTESRNKLLTFDFGGGTIDVSLVDVNINRTEDRKIKALLTVEGITGARHYGGDNVTLEVFKLLKNRLALTIANECALPEEPEEEEEVPREEEKKEVDIFADDSSDDDLWSVDDDSEQEGEGEDGGETPEEEEENDELSDIVNDTDEDLYNAAVRTVASKAEIIEICLKENVPFEKQLLESAGSAGGMTATMAKNEAAEIEKAMELLCPTRFDVYKDEDPIKAKVARILFNEIWNEADRMKVRASVSPDGIAELGMEMKKVAKYAGIEDHSVFNRNVKISIEEIQHRVKPDIASHVRKAWELYKSTRKSSYGGLQVGDAAADTTEDLTVILSGNSSRLAIVKDIFLEVFDVQENQIKMDDESIKKDVAQGACEEFSLQKEFGGEEGLISFQTEGFLDKLPFTVGLFQKDLSLAGYENGFCPLISRGSALGIDVVLTSENPLIHPGLETLAVYADYHDGGDPFYIGWFDLSKPAEERAEDAAAPADAEFSLVLRITENRDLKLINPLNKVVFNLIEKPDAPSAKENPFSGIY